MVEGKTASVTFRGSRLRSRDLEGEAPPHPQPGLPRRAKGGLV